jgi:hypothetical protein
MAEVQTATYSDKPVTEKQKAQDFQEHAKTYHAFLGLAKWGTIAVAVLLIGLYVFLVL